MRGETKRALLLFVRGLPGAGKSDLVDLLLESPPLRDSLRLDPDRVNLANPKFVEFVRDLPIALIPKRQIYRYLLWQADEALRRGQHVIWEQPWRMRWGLYITIENLTYFQTGGEDIAKAPFQTVLAEVLIDLAKARQRVAVRFAEGRHSLSPANLEKFVGTMESCDGLGMPSIQIDGNDVAKEVHAVENLITQLLETGKRRKLDVYLSG